MQDKDKVQVFPGQREDGRFFVTPRPLCAGGWTGIKAAGSLYDPAKNLPSETAADVHAIPGVAGVRIEDNEVFVVKDEGADWDVIGPCVIAFIERRLRRTYGSEPSLQKAPEAKESLLSEVALRAWTVNPGRISHGLGVCRVDVSQPKPDNPRRRLFRVIAHVKSGLHCGRRLYSALLSIRGVVITTGSSQGLDITIWSGASWDDVQPNVLEVLRENVVNMLALERGVEADWEDAQASTRRCGNMPGKCVVEKDATQVIAHLEHQEEERRGFNLLVSRLVPELAARVSRTADVARRYVAARESLPEPTLRTRPEVPADWKPEIPPLPPGEPITREILVGSSSIMFDR